MWAEGKKKRMERCYGVILERVLRQGQDVGFFPLARELTSRLETLVPGLGALGKKQVRGG